MMEEIKEVRWEHFCEEKVVREIPTTSNPLMSKDKPIGLSKIGDRLPRYHSETWVTGVSESMGRHVEWSVGKLAVKHCPHCGDLLPATAVSALFEWAGNMNSPNEG